MKKAHIYILTILIYFFSCNPDDKLPALPGSSDVREYHVFTKVKNQDILDCNRAFASISLVEYIIYNKYGVEVDLSEQQLVNCSENNIPDILTFLKDNGVTKEAQTPYLSVKEACNKNVNTEYKIEDFKTISLQEMSFEKRINSLQILILDGYPFITTLDLYSDLKSYQTGIYRHNENAKLTGKQAVLVIGYQSFDTNVNDGYWICRNSWGDTWGEDGYFKIPYDECNIGVNEAYIIENVVKTETIENIKNI